jgi:hypothetical protein
VTDAADNQTVSAPFAVYARGSANGANVTDSARLTAGFPAKVYRRSKAGKRYYTYVLRPSRTVSYGTATGGRFRTTYRFERTQRPVRYRFRAKVVRQAGLPYATGASRTVIVSVRP